MGEHEVAGTVVYPASCGSAPPRIAEQSGLQYLPSMERMRAGLQPLWSRWTQIDSVPTRTRSQYTLGLRLKSTRWRAGHAVCNMIEPQAKEFTRATIGPAEMEVEVLIPTAIRWRLLKS